MLSTEACYPIRLLNYAGTSISGQHCPDSTLSMALNERTIAFESEDRYPRPTKVKWRGIASFGSLLAVCVIMVVSDSLEIGGSSEDTARIIFTDGIQSGKIPRFPWQRKIVRPTQSAASIADFASDRTVSTILDSLLRFLSLRTSTIDIISAKILLNFLHICIAQVEAQNFARDQAYQTVVDLFVAVYGPENFETVIGLLAARSRRFSINVSGYPQPIMSADGYFGRYRLLFDGTNLDDLTDECAICKSQLRPQLSVRCSNGHPFSRCSLTFLPIFDPKVMKVCSDCGREFINQYRHPAVYQPQDHNSEAAGHGLLEQREGSTFAQFLFDTFNICPYCEGYYRS